MNIEQLTQLREYVCNKMINLGGVLVQSMQGPVKEISKGGLDLATQQDIDTGEALSLYLSSLLQGSLVLNEETSTGSYEGLDEKELMWVIDPIDGTANFRRKASEFAISVALLRNGSPILGVTHRPAFNQTFWAQEGIEGAYCDGKSICVSTTSSLDQGRVDIDLSWDLHSRDKTGEILLKLNKHTRQILIRGSSVFVLGDIAMGNSDALAHPGVKPWDVAAGVFIAQKAGGKATRLNGEPWGVFHPDILVSNGQLHQAILEKINS